LRYHSPEQAPGCCDPVRTSRLLDRLRIDRRAGAAGDDQRWPAEEEFVYAVARAIGGELLEIEDFPHAQAHGRNHHPMPGLVRFGRLVGADLDAPRIGADRRYFLLPAPIAILELDARRVAPRVAAPLLLGKAALHLPGADDDEIPAPDLDLLRLRASVELLVADAFPVLEPLDAAQARDVEQHAASHHSAFGMLDAQHAQSIGIDELGLIAVIGLFLVEDVAERVPVRRPLHAQIKRVVGVADLVPVLPAGNGIGAGGEHLVDGIEPPAEQAGLRTVAVERDAEREHPAGADEARGLDDILRRDVIECADLIVLAPAAPVAEFFRRFRNRLLAHLDVHRLFPHYACSPLMHAYVEDPRHAT
jgi:hypothetical protein